MLPACRDARESGGRDDATVKDAWLRDRLDDAIRGRGAFSRFRNVLEDRKGEQERWFAFKRAWLRKRILTWLDDEGIDVAPKPDT